MDLKEQLKRQLIGNVIKDKCKQCARIFFNEARCTQDKIIRFETPYSRETGKNQEYEIENNITSLIIRYEAKSWTIDDGDTNLLFQSFDNFLTTTLPQYEKSLKGGEFTEGEVEAVTSTKYERNQKARAASLAALGTACFVCGIDFEKTYGPEFAGKIEVHHIVPLSEIRKGYVINPITDLVPGCPNCHTALHSKKDGVYTIEELKKLRLRHPNR